MWAWRGFFDLGISVSDGFGSAYATFPIGKIADPTLDFVIAPKVQSDTGIDRSGERGVKVLVLWVHFSINGRLSEASQRTDIFNVDQQLELVINLHYGLHCLSP